MPLGQLKKGILNPKRYPMPFEHRKWVTANKKCLAVIKNMIEPAIMGSIPECDTVTEYLDRIKSQFTSSSKDICHLADKAAGHRVLIWKRWHKTAHDAFSKLWHCRLGHISRGRIERQVKNDILPPLELSD